MTTLTGNGSHRFFERVKTDSSKQELPSKLPLSNPSNESTAQRIMIEKAEKAINEVFASQPKKRSRR